jgi:hypothetical protein
MLRATKPPIIDADAVKIGARFKQANQARAEALRAYWDCGDRQFPGAIFFAIASNWEMIGRPIVGMNSFYSAWLTAACTLSCGIGRRTARPSQW